MKNFLKKALLRGNIFCLVFLSLFIFISPSQAAVCRCGEPGDYNDVTCNNSCSDGPCAMFGGDCTLISASDDDQTTDQGAGTNTTICQCGSEGDKIDALCDSTCKLGECAFYGGCTNPSPAGPTAYEQFVDPNQFTPVTQVAIGPNVILLGGVNCSAGEDCEIPWISEYIKIVYQYLVGLSAILAAIMILIGGFLWLLSAGSPDRISTAKELIVGALSGLALALLSYLILYTINPELILNRPIKIKVVTPLLTKMADQKYGDKAATAAAAGCPDAASASTGFPALITSYCHPQPEDYGTLEDYCCAAAMNCSCAPGGKYDTSKSCPGGVNPCTNCTKDQTICTATSSGKPPQSDIIAADQSCFPNNSQVCIGGQTYTVGDKGGAIKGSHFDLWNEDCADAVAVGGQTVNVTTGACK